MSVQSGFGAAAAAAGATAAMLAACTFAFWRSLWADAVWLNIEARAASSAAPYATFGVAAFMGSLFPWDVADNMMSHSSTVKSNPRSRSARWPSSRPDTHTAQGLSVTGAGPPVLVA